jgi:alkylation response protein AidB-like acyl-CoA dehydrogenase
VNFQFSEEQLAIAGMCKNFARSEIQPKVRDLEKSGKFPKDIFRKMAELGLLTMTVPEEAGGTYTDTISYMLALSAISKADAGVAVAMAVTNMVAESIYRFGTEAQKKKYLPGFADGSILAGAFGLTESQAGSDPGALRTRAELDKDDGDYFTLTGEKIFITSGDVAGVIIVMAKTRMPEGSDKTTAFLVEPGMKGFQVGRKEEKLGLLSSSTVSLVFDRCRVHKNQVLGQMGKGMSQALGVLDSGRVSIAAQAIGIAEAAFEEAARYSKVRMQFGRHLSQNQAIQFKLADMKVKLEAAKLLMFRAASLKDAKKTFTQEASIAKLFATEMCNEVVGEAVQIHGGYGYTKEFLVEKYFRDARVTTIYEGTSEIQRIVIAKKLLEDF